LGRLQQILARKQWHQVGGGVMASLGEALDCTMKKLVVHYLKAKEDDREFRLRDAIFFSMTGLENALGEFAMTGLENAFGEQKDYSVVKQKYSLNFIRTMENIERIILEIESAWNDALILTRGEYDIDDKVRNIILHQLFEEYKYTHFVLDRMGFNWDGTAWDIDWNDCDELNEKYENNTFSLHKNLLN
jgi:hypothetical protein